MMRPATAVPAPLDTKRMGDAVRNLTRWEDVHASGTAFAVGNALFAMVFLGRRALMLLWLAFVTAFIAPKRLDMWDWIRERFDEAALEGAIGFGETVVDTTKSAVAGVRARLGF